ncbi:alcohol dehydrogenase catalytic domain-containing protein [Candidatus Uabimicrobium sp. HlEnr_7]|uniref:MDR/zinc-dependent alcohol dehydrogenase-like family protein n=1 Tax=Candidatus Uabimicrobium helgolandensis TaxID=3095367 RepID=UPI003555CDAE
MIALSLSKGNLSLKKAVIPEIKPLYSLVKITLAGICSTDLHLLKGYKGFSGIPGHEFVGTVVESEESFLLNKRVVGEINIGCEKCDMCSRQIPNHCRYRKVLGILNYNGVHAEYALIPNKNLYVVPSHINDKDAVFVEPLAAACRIFHQLNISKDTSVAVIGDGKLSFTIATALIAKGCLPKIVGKYSHKLNIFKSLGCSVQKNDEHNDFRRTDVVIECTGSPSGVDLALEMICPQGVLVLKSTYSGTTPVSLSDIVVNEISVVGSRCGLFSDALKLLSEHSLNFSSIVESIFPLSEGVKAYEAAQRPGAQKILLDCEQ